ncbi:SpoIIIAH-like family protein [Brevibacillus sp. SYSU BS000544]|uniref:SpoIIIAH-like family protein n=1 Tax=Brevibacillus sp. SYSU BS000544 TaxID=3416443 RepID=UPI003CE4AA8A
MLLRKQTVWLLTMLAVMVVLSGYYLVKGPNQQMPALGDKTKQEAPLTGVEVSTEETDLPGVEATPVEGQGPTIETPTSTESNVDASSLPETASDYFQGYRMKREAMLQQQKDEQMEIMTNGEATPQAIAEAKAKHEELSNLETKTLAMEELLKAKGYKDAIVYVQDKNVDVIVQKDKLQAQEVVDVIALAKQHFQVSGSNVTVRFKQ